MTSDMLESLNIVKTAAQPLLCMVIQPGLGAGLRSAQRPLSAQPEHGKSHNLRRRFIELSRQAHKSGRGSLGDFSIDLEGPVF